MELHAYRLNPSHPDHVQRSRPKARLRVEMRLDAGPEVAELPAHPRALRHIEHGEASFLGEDCILDVMFFGEGKVLLRGEAAVGGHLPGRPPILRVVLGKEGLVLIAVGRSGSGRRSGARNSDAGDPRKLLIVKTSRRDQGILCLHVASNCPNPRFPTDLPLSF